MRAFYHVGVERASGTLERVAASYLVPSAHLPEVQGLARPHTPITTPRTVWLPSMLCIAWLYAIASSPSGSAAEHPLFVSPPSEPEAWGEVLGDMFSQSQFGSPFDAPPRGRGYSLTEIYSIKLCSLPT